RMRRALVLLFVLLSSGGGLAFYLHGEWQTAGSAVGGVIDIPQGLGAREIVRLLQDKKVIRRQASALAYIFYSGTRNKLQAGEYLFDHPMTIPEIIGKLATGSVFLHKFTVPEGLTTAAIAQKWQEEGFGSAEEFLDAAARATDLVRRFDKKADVVEGYL